MALLKAEARAFWTRTSSKVWPASADVSAAAACVTHGHKNKADVDKYGREAMEKTITDAIGVLKKVIPSKQRAATKTVAALFVSLLTSARFGAKMVPRTFGWEEFL